MTRFRTIALTIATTALPLAAQDRQQALRERLEAKLAESWVDDSGWLIDYEAALAAAKASDALVLAYFTRSYAP